MRLVPEPAGPSWGGPASAGEVFSLVRDGRADTRSELGRVTGLSRTAVASRVQQLLDLGLVRETTEPERPGPGRPPARLVFDRTAGVVLAAAIGRSRTQLAVCDLEGDVLVTRDVDQEVGTTPDVLMPRVVELLGELLGELQDGAGRPPSDVRGVGISIPGTVDEDKGASLDSPIMTGWDGVPLSPYVAPLTDAPVYVDNDANVMALSERRGHLEHHRDLLFLKASTGIGVGVVARGGLVRGRLGAAGEIGHTRTALAASLPCRCGDTGCLETVASGWALVQAAQEIGLEVDHVRDLVALAAHGEGEARQLVRTAGRRIGEVLAASVNLLNPEVVVVGGDLAGAYDHVVAGLRESLYATATSLATRDLVIAPLTHGERSGVVGCAALALSHVLDSSAVDRALAGR